MMQRIGRVVANTSDTDLAVEVQEFDCKYIPSMRVRHMVAKGLGIFRGVRAFSVVLCLFVVRVRI